MDFIKKNLTVILLSVICLLLLAIVILLATDNKIFKFSNFTTSNNTKEENVKKDKDNKKEINKQEESKDEKDVEESVKENKKIDREESKQETKKEENVTSVQEEKSEAKLSSMFNDQEKLFTNNNDNESMSNKLKDSFTSIVDFIFYDKEIKGYKFKELTNSAKLKVVSTALTIDNKIDSYFPNYKDKIKDKYTSIKGKLALKYLEVTTNFCNKDPDTCNQAKIDFNNMKESFGLTFDLLKELAKNGTSKVKDLYESWRDQ